MAKRAVAEWAVLGETSKVRRIVPDSDYDYDLLNVKIAEALVYGERTFGINLVWADPRKSDNIRFARKSGSRTSIKYGESIAIGVRGGDWLVYKKRTVGINLGWSDEPRFEWRIDGGKAGEVVTIPKLVALHNSIEDDWLMYVPRELGINLRWSGDEGTRAWLVPVAQLGQALKKQYDWLY
jgi:hypothetical protein